MATNNEPKTAMNSSLDINERLYVDKLSCAKSTKKLIMENCVKEFLKHHPELAGAKITQNMILTQLANFYLNKS